MTGKRLAKIRRAEQEGRRVHGHPKRKLHWLGHRDGELEYVDKRPLVNR
jgi:hypothetical protein